MAVKNICNTYKWQTVFIMLFWSHIKKKEKENYLNIKMCKRYKYATYSSQIVNQT